MQEYNGYIHSPDGIRESLRRNKMLGRESKSMPKKKIASKGGNSDVLQAYVFEQLNTNPIALLANLNNQYYAEENFRFRRNRNVDFTRGRNLGEMVYDAELKRNVTQWQYLKRRNLPPLTYNIVSKLGRSLVGQFREINTGNIVRCESKDAYGQELAHVLTECMNRVKNNNKSKSKDARNMKEMIHSGRPVFKVLWGSKNNMSKKDIRFRVVSTVKFGINPGVNDDDFANLNTAYEIHDTSMNDILEMFSRGDYDRGQAIKAAYFKQSGDHTRQSSYGHQSYDGSALRSMTFNNEGIGTASYRYFEVWHKISDYEASTYDPLELPGNDFKVYKYQKPENVRAIIDGVNEQRRINADGQVDPKDIEIRFEVDYRSRWYVTYITPWGYVLDVKESPYKNGMLPYVMPSPDLNGEMWGLLEEVIDPQLSMNRQIQQADAVIANAAKGMWLVPSDAVPDDMSNREYLNVIKQSDGAVIVQMKDGQNAADVMPKQVYANATNIGNQVHQMITLYANLVDEISGNYGAAQGRDQGSGKTATGYALESQNAGLNVKDMFETYLDVLAQRDELILMFLLEGYTKQDYLKIVGREIDPKEFRQFEFSIEQSKGTNSPTHRAALESELLQLVYNQLLPFEVFLEVSNNPVMVQAKQKLQEYNKNQAMANQPQQQGAGGDYVPQQPQEDPRESNNPIKQQLGTARAENPYGDV